MKELKEIVSTCRFLLENNFPGTEKVKSYLDSRISKEVQEKFQFGYFPNEENFNILSSLVDKEKLIKCKLAYEKVVNEYYDDPWDYLDDDDIDSSGACKTDNKTYAKTNKQISNYIEPVLKNHNLVMPYNDPYGNPIAIVGRTILENYNDLNISKYKNTSFNKANNLFGLDLAKEEILKQDLVYVVEGQFDCIKAHENKLYNIVALGSSSMTNYQLSLILRYTKNIMLILDNDEAGIKGRSLIINKFGKLANFGNLYCMSPFKDLDEYLTSVPGYPTFSTKPPKI